MINYVKSKKIYTELLKKDMQNLILRNIIHGLIIGKINVIIPVLHFVQTKNVLMMLKWVLML